MRNFLSINDKQVNESQKGCMKKSINCAPQTFWLCHAWLVNHTMLAECLVFFMQPGDLWKYGVSGADLQSSLTLPTVISILMTHHRHPGCLFLQIERLMRCSYHP